MSGEAMIDECFVGDVSDGLRAFAAAGIEAQTCVTSPPYWGLRDYGVSGQIGLEPTIAEYVEKMVAVFREVRRVLRDDGTLWLNLGDSYHNGDKGGYARDRVTAEDSMQKSNLGANFIGAPNRNPQEGLKPKDLCGIPWRVAFALQADGWYLRQDIIWAKPNPMPESVRDRCTKAHEYIFLLSKSERYYYDAEAIKEDSITDDIRTPYGSEGAWALDGRPVEQRNGGKPRKTELAKGFRGGSYVGGEPGPRAETGNTYAPEGFKRNKRSVWTVATAPFKEAHFATFPPALIEPCILAGSRTSDIVLDPFMGSGTVAQVSQSLGRRWIGCELNPAYVTMQSKRASQRGLELIA